LTDVLSAVDHAVAHCGSDSERLCVGGWSYGGILTNQIIVSDHRFKAAITGASALDYRAGYGHDQYQMLYEQELGLPWEHPETCESTHSFALIFRMIYYSTSVDPRPTDRRKALTRKCGFR
jgi:dipeptidyl aminopeptidase/acylaminoacyl peptidase